MTAPLRLFAWEFKGEMHTEWTEERPDSVDPARVENITEHHYVHREVLLESIALHRLEIGKLDQSITHLRSALIQIRDAAGQPIPEETLALAQSDDMKDMMHIGWGAAFMSIQNVLLDALKAPPPAPTSESFTHLLGLLHRCSALVESEAWAVGNGKWSKNPEYQKSILELHSEIQKALGGATVEPGIPHAPVAQERTVTVCDNCLTASCWHGLFMCDEAQTAGTVEKTVAELEALKREHPQWWNEETYQSPPWANSAARRLYDRAAKKVEVTEDKS